MGGFIKHEEESRHKVRKWNPIAIVFAIVALAVIAAFVRFGPSLFSSSDSNKITKDDVVSASDLVKAIEIDRLSTAEFVYNGIAEHYRPPLYFWENEDVLDYRISYKARVKAGIDMTDVDFVVDENAKTVSVKLPELTLSSIVDPNDMQFIPGSVDANPQEALETCKRDVELEANISSDLRNAAEQSMKSVIKALTIPIIEGHGYSLVWTKVDDHE